VFKSLRIFGAIIMVIHVLAFSGSLAVAQEGAIGAVGPDRSTASLQETLSWLRDHAPRFFLVLFRRKYLHWDHSDNTISFGPDYESANAQFKWIDAGKCKLRFERTTTTVKGEEKSDIYDLPLAELDPSSITIQRDANKDQPLEGEDGAAWGICLEDRSGKDGFQIVDQKRLPARLEGRAFTIGVVNTLFTMCSHYPDRGLPVQDRESAARVARAFKHAAILCGAKVAPF
jgi:hypothetical protein